MAHCVISAIVDTEDPTLPLVTACVVHTSFTPCEHYGEPANPAPLHALNGTRDEKLRLWQVRTHRQRPLLVHNDSAGMDAEDHTMGTGDTSCSCGAEFLPAEEVPVGSAN